VYASTTVHAVATPLNTCRASRARRDECVAPYRVTSAIVSTRLVTSRHDFSPFQNAWARFRVVWRHHVASEVEFGLIRTMFAVRQQCDATHHAVRSIRIDRRHRLGRDLLASCHVYVSSSRVCGSRAAMPSIFTIDDVVENDLHASSASQTQQSTDEFAFSLNCRQYLQTLTLRIRYITTGSCAVQCMCQTPYKGQTDTRQNRICCILALTCDVW